MTRDERGFATAQWTVLIVISFVLLTWFTNTLLLQYQRASARSALADAARIAARTPSMDADACAAKVLEVLERISPATKNSNTFRNAQCTGTLAENSGSPSVTARVEFDFSQAQFLPSRVAGGGLKGTMSITVQTRQKAG